MAILGCADGMDGAYAHGWAVTRAHAGHCLVVLIDDRGVMVAKGVADQPRPDLSAIGLGRTDFSFKIPLTLTHRRRVLHVLADGEELPGSPILVGEGQFDSHCWMENGAVAGWVRERVKELTTPVMTVVDQFGREVGRGPSVERADAALSAAGFKIELADVCFGAGELALNVFADGVRLTQLACNLRLEGNLETVTPESCSGWLLSPDAPERCFEIEIFRDGERAATAKCQYIREDVRAIYPGCVTPGFGCALEEPEDEAVQTCSLSLRLAGAGTELFKGPYRLASQQAAVTAAYRAARLANQGVEGIGGTERAVLQIALGDYLAKARLSPWLIAAHQAGGPVAVAAKPRLAIIVPIYRGVAETQACIESVLAVRNAETDQLVLINDATPEPEMGGMLATYAGRPNLFVLHNANNLGFIQTVNRGLKFAAGADVLLLNADTVMFAGALDELHRLAYAHGDIGIVTAMSNNATIFSYPHVTLRQETLPDISWAELAQAALVENAGRCVDVPTGHGFCMFIKREVLHCAGLLDESFGRGYGEENDFCARAAALGYRSVAACGVLVEHKESVSFAGEKAGLLARNMPRLNALYPEYSALIMDYERSDGLRRARWALDALRLKREVAAGQRFALVVSNGLEGGTAKAVADLEANIGYGGATALKLCATKAGMLELSCAAPLLLASFTMDEVAALLGVLNAAAPTHVLVHQLLGFPAAFVRALGEWSAGRQSVFYVHDFYSFCPRVTMIDAIGRFCDVAGAETCARCVGMEGAHENSRLTELTPEEHRALFGQLLGGFKHVVTPSANAAGYMRRAFPGLAVEEVAHPETPEQVPEGPRAGTDDEIVVLGAIGPHKGSGKLLEIARLARLTHPRLSFRVIGYTDIDKALLAVGNVTLTGAYKPERLAELLAQARGRLALFLSPWPETYSYTLSETVKHGFIPLLPDIGAPAERVRAAGYGVVFPSPVDAQAVLAVIDDIAAGRVAAVADGASPRGFFPDAAALRRAAEVLTPAAKPGKRARRLP
jgi:GT2 family glycosyltransferase/glycosyltransferase involved in cell wall biosynthesis